MPFILIGPGSGSTEISYGHNNTHGRLELGRYDTRHAGQLAATGDRTDMDRTTGGRADPQQPIAASVPGHVHMWQQP